MLEQSTEDRLIEALFARHSADGEGVLIGPGDDAAMVRCPDGEELLITTDTLNEGVHFPLGASAHSIGHRALAVSLSDLAAMAARPLWAVVTLSVPSANEKWLKEFADGLYELANRFGVRVVGGDFARGPLNVTVTAHGSAKSAAVMRRNGANAGDAIWVSGSLGDAAAGLTLLKPPRERAHPPPRERAHPPPRERAHPPPRERGHPALAKNKTPHQPPWERGHPALAESKTPSLPTPEAKTLIHRFFYPQPRVELGRKLAGIATACMDLSDGLLLDLPRLLRKCQLGARVMAEQVPLSNELRAVADPEEAMTLCLTGGDDYELCFTVAPEDEHLLAPLSAELPLSRIGELHAGEGLEVTLHGAIWRPSNSGFAHFS